MNNLRDRFERTATAKVGTQAIETLRVGDRVLAHNPQVTDAERAELVEPQWQEWLHLSLAMPKPDGSLLQLSGEELQALFVEMDLPELAITGPAVVQQIQKGEYGVTARESTGSQPFEVASGCPKVLVDSKSFR